MFLSVGVCEKNKSGDILQGVLEKGETRDGNHGFTYYINIRRRIINGG